MADEDVTITFGTDLSKVRDDVANLKRDVERDPVKLAVGGTGNPASPTPGGSGVPMPYAGAATGANAAYYQQFHNVWTNGGTGLPPVASAGTAAAPAPFAGTSLAPVPWQPQGHAYFKPLTPSQVAQNATGGGAPPPVATGGPANYSSPYPTATGGGSAVAGGGGPAGSPGSYTQADLNQLAAVQAANTPGGGTAAGQARAASYASSAAIFGRGRGISGLRGAAYAFGGFEAIHAYQGSRRAADVAGSSDTMAEQAEAYEQSVEQQTSGAFGSMIGLAMEFTPGAYAPSDARRDMMQARAGLRTDDRVRRAQLGRTLGQNTRRGGAFGEYGSGLAGIQNEYTSSLSDINNDRGNLSAITDPARRAREMKALDLREQEAKDRHNYEVVNLQQRLELKYAEYQDDSEVYRQGGRLSHGRAGRNAIVRENALLTNPHDQEMGRARLDAYDTQEAYRTGLRTYGAQADVDVAQANYDRKPNVGRAIGMYAHGAMEAVQAKRDGTPEEASLILQRTALELKTLKRDLILGGDASFYENAAAVDYGQLGTSGPGHPASASYKEGDDLTEAVNKINEKLDQLIGMI